MKKICYFLGSFQVGGGENHVLQILKQIDRTKFKPYICVFRNYSGLKTEFEKLNIPIISFPYWRRNPLTANYQLFRYIHFLKKNKIDIVHIHLVGCFKFGIKGSRIAKTKKIILTWHGLYDRQRVKNFRYVSYGSKRADKIIAVSKNVKINNCRIYKIDPKKVEVIYNGIDTSLFEPNIVKINKIMQFVVGCVGNLRHEKGHYYLIEAVSKLKNKIPGIKLQIAGDGPLFDDLKKLTILLGINDITEFLGQRNNIPKLLKTFDIWVMPSVYEGFSVALLEAMAAGLPIIATDVGGNAEAIEHNKSGLIIPAKNVEALKVAIYKMYIHHEKRIEFSENAKKRCREMFNTDAMLERLYRAYR